MTRVLAIADEVNEALYGETLSELAPDVVVSCGDLPFDYLEYLVTVTNVPLLYVVGNHDPPLEPDASPDPLRPDFLDASHREPLGPAGCESVDGRVVDVAGLRIAGLGGAVRYSPGCHQYSQAQMRWRALKLETRTRLRALRDGRSLDVIVTHVPPLELGDRSDEAHQGAAAFHGLVERLRPKVLIHGHIHPYGADVPDRCIGSTSIVNAVGYRLLEVPA